MAGTIMPSPWFTGLDDNGVTVIGGKLFTYAAGTSTPQATFADVNLTVANPNPVILDGGGRAIVYLDASLYKFVLKDANDVTIKSQDNISATASFNVDLDIAGVAGENLPAGSVVYLSVGAETPTPLTKGRWYLADADFSFSSLGADFVALVQNAVVAGAVGAFRLQGRTTVPGPLTIGAAYFVSTVAGGLVTPKPALPAFERLVGIADSLTTIVSATGFGTSTVISGDVNVGGNLAVDGQTSLGQDLVFVGDYCVRRNTTNGADTGRVSVCSGGGPFAPGGPQQDRGALITLYGNEAAGPAGVLALEAGAVASGQIQFYTGPPGTLRGVMYQSGGFSWGSTVDPGAGNVSIPGTISIGGRVTLTGDTSIVTNTVDGADTGFIHLSGGGAGVGEDRGALVSVYGNESSGLGGLDLSAGTPSGIIRIRTNSLTRGVVHPSGAWCFGGTLFDSGLPTLLVIALPGVTVAAGQTWTRLQDGALELANAGTALTPVLNFINTNGIVGTVQTTGTSTLYNTTSDATLKTDRGVVTETDILARTRIHDFDWKRGGSGRGVFAQEVQAVLPGAVGGDEGALGVDYSKFVPDLIVGWQQHEARMRSVLERLERIESRRDGEAS